MLVDLKLLPELRRFLRDAKRRQLQRSADGSGTSGLCLCQDQRKRPDRPLMAAVRASADERAPGSAWLPPPCSLFERVPQVSPEQFVESAPAAAERGAVGRRPGA